MEKMLSHLGENCKRKINMRPCHHQEKTSSSQKDLVVKYRAVAMKVATTTFPVSTLTLITQNTLALDRNYKRINADLC